MDNVGNTNLFAYDSRGNRVSHVNPNGNEAVWVYDGMGRAVAQTNFEGRERGITINTSHVEYDTKSRLIASTDANTNTTTYVYDALDRLVRTTYADGTTSTNDFDVHDNLRLSRDANGSVLTFDYDLLNRLTGVAVVPGPGVSPDTTFESYSYDGLSRLVHAQDNDSLVTYAYDSLGNLVRETLNNRTNTSTYDGDGNRLSLTYPSGRVVTYTYDELNQITGLSTPLVDAAPPVLVASFAYDGPGRVTRIARTNGVNTRINWSGFVGAPAQAGDFGWAQVARINHQVGGGGAVIDRREFAYDRNQNKTLRAQTTPFFPGGPTTTNAFEYDALDRLVGFSRASGLPDDVFRGYVLDGNGNRQMALSNGMVFPYVMDATLPVPGDFQMNQYTVTPFNERQYDENGNLHRASSGDPTDPGRTFVYDYANRLVAVEDATGPVAGYAYDALGRHISKTVRLDDGTVAVTEYVYDGDAIIEQRVGGALTRSLFRTKSPPPSQAMIANQSQLPATTFIPEIGDEVLVAFDAAGQALYYHCDDLGNVLALTDAAGNVIERYDYDDYGAPTFLTPDGQPATGADGLPLRASAVGNFYLFQGMEWDDETGLYANVKGIKEKVHFPLYDSGRSGYMDPQTGSHLTRVWGDPHVSERAFAGNNPWSAGQRVRKTGSQGDYFPMGKGINSPNLLLRNAAKGINSPNLLIRSSGGGRTLFRAYTSIDNAPEEKERGRITNTQFTFDTTRLAAPGGGRLWPQPGYYAREGGHTVGAGQVTEIIKRQAATGYSYAIYSTQKGLRTSAGPKHDTVKNTIQNIR